MRNWVLQDYIVPVCLYEEVNLIAHLRHLIGTAFFINETGLFLTASHVIEHCNAIISSKNYKIGLVTKPKCSELLSQISPVISLESAPSPFDIIIGTVSFASRSWFDLFSGEIDGWKDIATLGYPISALNDAGTFNIHLRMLKGYVQRTIKPGELPSLANGRHPGCFELSFPITSGLSGAPLFVPQGGRNLLIGICVGSVKSEIVEYSVLDLDENGHRYKENVSRIEQYGIAHSLMPLSAWCPRLLRGARLFDSVIPSSI